MNVIEEDVHLPIKKEWVKPELLNEEVDQTEGGYWPTNVEGGWIGDYHS